MQNKKRVLVLAPHTDDGEFGCGGTISKMISEGHDVYYAAFSACQQSVLPQFPSDILITEVKAATKVDLIFMPDLQDIHQDHATIATEGLRAFKFASILSYELPWNNLTFTTSSFVHLSEEHVKTKVQALQEYQSQAHRPYSDEDFLRSLARTRGVQIGTRYAEAFNIVRWIID
jgi:LmbE family N-acetylglucosaminyl deacetylase